MYFKDSVQSDCAIVSKCETDLILYHYKKRTLVGSYVSPGFEMIEEQVQQFREMECTGRLFI